MNSKACANSSRVRYAIYSRDTAIRICSIPQLKCKNLFTNKQFKSSSNFTSFAFHLLFIFYFYIFTSPTTGGVYESTKSHRKLVSPSFFSTVHGAWCMLDRRFDADLLLLHQPSMASKILVILVFKKRRQRSFFFF